MTPGDQPDRESRAPKKISPAELKQVGEVVQGLVVALKNVGLYRHSQERTAEAIGRAHGRFQTFIQNNGALSLTIGPYQFTYKGNEVYRDDSKENNLSYRFYRDGIRALTFAPGLAPEEMSRFINITLTNFDSAEYRHEDMVTMLWREDLPNISHVAIEGFEDLGAQSEGVEIEELVSALYESLSGDGRDSINFAGLAAEDLEDGLEGGDLARASILADPLVLSEEEESRLQEVLQESGEDQNTKKILRILFTLAVKSDNPHDVRMIADGLGQLLDAALLRDDLSTAPWILGQLDQMSGMDIPPSRRESVLLVKTSFVEHMGDPARIQVVMHAAQTHALAGKEIAEELEGYLRVVAPMRQETLLDLVESLEENDLRDAVTNALASSGVQAQLVAERLPTAKGAAVRSLMHILRGINPPNLGEYLTQCLANPSPGVRLEALRYYSEHPDPSVSSVVAERLTDPESAVRLAAVRVLGVSGASAAQDALCQALDTKQFSARNERDRAVLLSVLADTDSPRAMEVLAAPFEVTGVKAFFVGRIAGEEKERALAALEKATGPNALALLTKLSDDGRQSKQIRRRAAFIARAMERRSGAGGTRSALKTGVEP